MYAFLLNPKADIYYFCKKTGTRQIFLQKRASCSDEIVIFAMSGGRNRQQTRKAFIAFVLRNKNRQKRTRRMKRHDAPLFCICHVRPAPHQHIKTAWEYCFRSFLVRRLAMPVFQCIADKSSRLFHNVKSNAEFGGLIGKKGDVW